MKYLESYGVELGNWLLWEADRERKQRLVDMDLTGWGDEVPQSLEEIQRQVSCGYLKVWTGNSDTTVFYNPQANYAMRYLHDLMHCRLGTGFDLLGEIATGQAQVASAMGFIDRPLQRVLMIDTVGQSLYAGFAGGNFPQHQRDFCKFVFEYEGALEHAVWSAIQSGL